MQSAPQAPDGNLVEVMGVAVSRLQGFDAEVLSCDALQVMDRVCFIGLAGHGRGLSVVFVWRVPLPAGRRYRKKLIGAYADCPANFKVLFRSYFSLFI